MMKKFTIIASLLVFFAVTAHAQLDNPVFWTYSAKKLADKTYELRISANITGNWHLYSQDSGGTDGPSTSIKFDVNPLVKLDGKTKESGKLEKAYDPNFKATLKYYGKQVEFIQKVRLKSTATTVVNGTVTYIVCNDRKCLPPKDVPFSIKIDGK